ncbi:MAG: hypothetical protein JNN12_03420 [Bacteroidetes Order II. Incertae sedis bacterium]|nr:hypothetical protein [Bacteroidetes Order II. bacterium]
MRLFWLLMIWFAGTFFTVAQPRKVANVAFQRNGDQILLSYDLIGKPKGRYSVQPYISLDGGQSRLRLSTIHGDVGPKIPSGLQKRIVWEVFKDFPEGIQSDQVVFFIEATEPRSKWMYGAGITVITFGISWFIWRQITALPNPPPKPSSASH